jgi:hypothetical protein
MTPDPNTSLFAISPGRFFAVIEIKALLAYILAMYDIKFEEGQGLPRKYCFAGLDISAQANVMLRTRQK